MKIRNVQNGDNSLTFSDGHSLFLSRAEVSRELTEKEARDPFLAKEIKARRVTVYREPIKKTKPKLAVEKKPEEKPERRPTGEEKSAPEADKKETKTIVKKKSPKKKAPKTDD